MILNENNFKQKYFFLYNTNISREKKKEKKLSNILLITLQTNPPGYILYFQLSCILSIFIEFLNFESTISMFFFVFNFLKHPF